MYSRNRIYISKKEQQQIRDFRLLFAGAGLGSVIAECALRMGFENITVIDGDKVERSNLNRQNYTVENLGKSKAYTLGDRLRTINPDAKIRVQHRYLTPENTAEAVQDCDAAINAIDFNSSAPFIFDEACRRAGVPALHPYNLGWAACVFVVNCESESESLGSISAEHSGFELHFVNYMLKRLAEQGYNTAWITSHMAEYANESAPLPPPQLSVASWMAAGMCTNILYRLATGRGVKTLPEFYFRATDI